MRILICDDDKLFLEQFCKAVNQAFAAYGQKAELICCCSGKELFKELYAQPADVLFLDIDMPDEDGFSIAARLSKTENKLLLIFTTSIESFVFDAFRYQPLWYLRKNHIEQLPEVIEKIIETRDKSQKDFHITISNKIHRFFLSDMIYFESNEHYLNLYTKDETYRFKGRLNDMESRLKDQYFIRCHASFLVNCRFIKMIGKNALLLLNNRSIPVSRSKWDDTQNTFMNYMGSLRL